MDIRHVTPSPAVMPYLNAKKLKEGKLETFDARELLNEL